MCYLKDLKCFGNEDGRVYCPVAASPTPLRFIAVHFFATPHIGKIFRARSLNFLKLHIEIIFIHDSISIILLILIQKSHEMLICPPLQSPVLHIVQCKTNIFLSCSRRTYNRLACFSGTSVSLMIQTISLSLLPSRCFLPVRNCTCALWCHLEVEYFRTGTRMIVSDKGLDLLCSRSWRRRTYWSLFFLNQW